MLSNSHLSHLENSDSASALLAALTRLSKQQFSDEQELKAAILLTITRQLQVRTSFFSPAQARKFETLDLFSSFDSQV